MSLAFAENKEGKMHLRSERQLFIDKVDSPYNWKSSICLK